MSHHFFLIIIIIKSSFVFHDQAKLLFLIEFTLAVMLDDSLMICGCGLGLLWSMKLVLIFRLEPTLVLRKLTDSDLRINRFELGSSESKLTNRRNGRISPSENNSSVVLISGASSHGSDPRRNDDPVLNSNSSSSFDCFQNSSFSLDKFTGNHTETILLPLPLIQPLDHYYDERSKKFSLLPYKSSPFSKLPRFPTRDR